MATPRRKGFLALGHRFRKNKHADAANGADAADGTVESLVSSTAALNVGSAQPSSAQPSSAQPSVSAGRVQYGPYVFGAKPIAQGGQGFVLAGEHVPTRQLVVIKFPWEPADGDEDTRKHIQRMQYREALMMLMIQARWPHDNSIVECHGVFETSVRSVSGSLEPTNAIVLTREERPLFEYPEARRQDEASHRLFTLTVLKQLTRDLALAYRLGIVHRDVKPDNVLIRQGGQSVALADFGAAMMTFDGRVSGKIGTVDYHAPEICAIPDGNETTPFDGHKADMWALGCVIYWLLTGSEPFPNHMALLDAASRERKAREEESRQAEEQERREHIETQRQALETRIGNARGKVKRTLQAELAQLLEADRARARIAAPEPVPLVLPSHQPRWAREKNVGDARWRVILDAMLSEDSAQRCTAEELWQLIGEQFGTAMEPQHLPNDEEADRTTWAPVEEARITPAQLSGLCGQLQLLLPGGRRPETIKTLLFRNTTAAPSDPQTARAIAHAKVVQRAAAVLHRGVNPTQRRARTQDGQPATSAIPWKRLT